MNEEKQWYVIIDTYERWIPQFVHYDPDVLKEMVEDDELFPLKTDIIIARCKIMDNGAIDLFGDEEDKIMACISHEKDDDGNDILVWGDCWGNDIPDGMTLKEFFENNGVVRNESG